MALNLRSIGIGLVLLAIQTAFSGCVGLDQLSSENRPVMKDVQSNQFLGVITNRENLTDLSQKLQDTGKRIFRLLSDYSQNKVGASSTANAEGRMLARQELDKTYQDLKYMLAELESMNFFKQVRGALPASSDKFSEAQIVTAAESELRKIGVEQFEIQAITEWLKKGKAWEIGVHILGADAGQRLLKRAATIPGREVIRLDKVASAAVNMDSSVSAESHDYYEYSDGFYWDQGDYWYDDYAYSSYDDYYDNDYYYADSYDYDDDDYYYYDSNDYYDYGYSDYDYYDDYYYDDYTYYEYDNDDYNYDNYYDNSDYYEDSYDYDDDWSYTRALYDAGWVAVGTGLAIAGGLATVGTWGVGAGVGAALIGAGLSFTAYGVQDYCEWACGW